jgi:hypothetical protein
VLVTCFGGQVWRLQQTGYSKEVDVFSLGIVLLDLLKQYKHVRVQLVTPVRWLSHRGPQTSKFAKQTQLTYRILLLLVVTVFFCCLEAG